MREVIIQNFNTKKSLYEAFLTKLSVLIEELLNFEKIEIHNMENRIKSEESLIKKIESKNQKYESLNDITDVAGLRIITYLESDVDKISELIKKEFLVDEKNSINKRQMNADQFGYQSLHLVISLNAERSELPEYKVYKDLKCELQIRSILQHAWAEIEHDLGYKGKVSIPDEYRRSFNRLAALLETADKEFDRLKIDISKYEKEVPVLIKDSPENVLINQTSLISFVSTNKTLINVSNIIKNTTNAEIYFDNDYEDMIKRFGFFNLITIKDLEDSLKVDEKVFVAFVKEFLKSYSKYPKLPSSIGVFYYQHFLSCKSEDPDIVKKYLLFSRHISGPLGIEETINRFLTVYKKAKESSK